MDTGTLYDAVVRLVNQRAGTTRTPEYGRAVLSEMTKGEPNRKKFYAALIEFLEAGEPAKKSRAYERLSTKFQKQLEIQDMATKKDTAKKTTAKKTSGFGNDKPVAPKGAVDRPKVPAKTEKKPFVATTPKELEEMEKRNKTKAEESKAAKEAGKTNSAKATAKKAAAAHKEAVGKAAGKKPAAANGEKKTRGGIGALAMELIQKGLNAESVIAEVKKKFPDSAINARHVAWYKNKLAREA